MRYNILNEEVQKEYYYVKKLLDSQGYTQQLGLYLRFGQKNQPQSWKRLSWVYALKPIIILLFIIGVVLLFTGRILLGIAIIIAGILISAFLGSKISKYLLDPTMAAMAEEASQEIGSHKLMKIVAEEMSNGSSREKIAEELKKEIEKVVS